MEVPYDVSVSIGFVAVVLLGLAVWLVKKFVLSGLAMMKTESERRNDITNQLVLYMQAENDRLMKRWEDVAVSMRATETALAQHSQEAHSQHVLLISLVNDVVATMRRPVDSSPK